MREGRACACANRQFSRAARGSALCVPLPIHHARPCGYPRGTTGYYDSTLAGGATVVDIASATRCTIRLVMGEITPHRHPPLWMVRYGHWYMLKVL
jgi:hypothetical protein